MIPSEDTKLVKSSDKIPASGDVASDEYPKREPRDGVHVPLKRS